MPTRTYTIQAGPHYVFSGIISADSVSVKFTYRLAQTGWCGSCDAPSTISLRISGDEKQILTIDSSSNSVLILEVEYEKADTSPPDKICMTLDEFVI